MNDKYCILFIALSLLQYSESLQSGYTCGTSVALTCPSGRKIIILEVTYSSECPAVNEEKEGGSIYAPSRCIGYYREHVNVLCNGKEKCIIDNSPAQRPFFVIGKQANCQFVGQSVNIDYSCIPDFYSSKLPRVDICSLQSLNDLTEGFIHTPNYPNGYSNGLTCSKTVPSPFVGHRLKIYSIDFDIEGFSVLRFFGIKRINDWFRINNSGEKLCGRLSAYTLLFDDVIEASLMFKSDFANTKRSYNGFLLYFVVVPIRTSRPLTTSTVKAIEESAKTNSAVASMQLDKHSDPSTVYFKSKSSALLSSERHKNNVRLTCLVVVLCGVILVGSFGFLLYKRRNDRRLRYLTDTFNSFFSHRTKNETLHTSDCSDDTTSDKKMESKQDSSPVNPNGKYTKMNNLHDESLQISPFKLININEQRENQEKQVFIQNLKASSSPYVPRSRLEDKFNAEKQVNETSDKNSNVYSEDPLVKINSSLRAVDDSLLYECIDLNEQTKEHSQEKESIKGTQQNPEQREIVYDVINADNERPVHQETDCDCAMYAIPKDV